MCYVYLKRQRTLSMPTWLEWQELDGGWAVALVGFFFGVEYPLPESYLVLRGPTGEQWCFRCAALEADAPVAPADDQVLQPEPEGS
jgi:hypothetical protein